MDTAPVARRANQFTDKRWHAARSASQAAKIRCSKTNFASQINLIWLFKTLGENISLFPKPKSVVSCARPAPTGGALRDRHGRWERDAMDAVVA
jgi:hypothetical protein